MQLVRLLRWLAVIGRGPAAAWALGADGSPPPPRPWPAATAREPERSPLERALRRGAALRRLADDDPLDEREPPDPDDDPIEERP